ncbi:MAG: hypothetical protein EOM22_14130, partial [Gammaproteobacteria bacterium]|nr:hypothetical protein [Gammaproteobacteria bacterium]
MDQTAYPILAISARSGRIFNLFASHDAPLIKADGGIPPGARWITVRSGGPGTKGTPVLIQETSPGSGVHRVVGGAGGKLNYLRLKGVKSEAQYRQEHASKRQAKKAEKAAQRKRDKELGLTDNKADAKRALKSERVNQEQEYIKTVADALGWTDHEFDPEPYQDLSVRAQSAAFQKHHRETLKRANEAVKLHEQQLMADNEARAKALGETPLESDDPETIALADLDPEPVGGGLGYAPAWKQQAEAKAGGADVIKAEKEAIEAAEPEEKREAKAKRKATTEALKAELETVRDPTPKEQEKVLVDVEKTVAMLKAKKQLALAKKKLADASRKVDEAKADPHAYVIEVDGPDEQALTEAVKADIESDLRTLKTRAFLSEVEKSGGEVAKDFGVGAYNSLNSIALTATGASLLDRQVVDALGVAGASQVLAKRLRDSLTPEELEDLQDGLQSFHMEHYMDASDKAMGEAARLQAAAEAITLDVASNGHDLAKMQELNAQRRDA